MDEQEERDPNYIADDEREAMEKEHAAYARGDSIEAERWRRKRLAIMGGQQ